MPAATIKMQQLVKEKTKLQDGNIEVNVDSLNYTGDPELYCCIAVLQK